MDVGRRTYPDTYVFSSHDQARGGTGYTKGALVRPQTVDSVATVEGIDDNAPSGILAVLGLSDKEEDDIAPLTTQVIAPYAIPARAWSYDLTRRRPVSTFKVRALGRARTSPRQRRPSNVSPGLQRRAAIGSTEGRSIGTWRRYQRHCAGRDGVATVAELPSCSPELNELARERV